MPFLIPPLLRHRQAPRSSATMHLRSPVALLLLGLTLCATLTSPAAAADELRPASGVWPLSPRPPVIAPFEAPAVLWGPGHRGVDLLGSPAQPVHSALAGTVVFAGRVAGRGVVVVDHGRTRTTYEPVSPTVGVGDRVAAGQMIGRLALVGSHCFPRWCLHWGYIEGHDHYLDPLLLVGAAQVILLPLDAPTGPGTAGRGAVVGSRSTAPGLRVRVGPTAAASGGDRAWWDPPVRPGLGVLRLGPARRSDVLLGLIHRSRPAPARDRLRLVDGPVGRPGGAGRS